MLNIVPFGEITHWEAEGTDYGVLWEDPREIHRVVVKFAAPPADPAAIQLQYWQSSWPHREIPRDAPSGSGQSGWMDIGDWYKGKWQTADAEVNVDGNVYSFTFRPVNAKEFPDLKNFSAKYRTTFKLGLLSESALPEVASFEACTDSIRKSFDLEIEWGGQTRNAERGTRNEKVGIWDGKVEVFNGALEKVEPISKTSSVCVAADRSWKSSVSNKRDGIRARVLCAETQHYNSFDETIVTVRTQGETFSFAPKDLLKWGYIVLPDFGVIVRKAGETLSYEEALQRRRTAPEKDLYSRVPDMPEQTFTRAWADTPAKGRHYIPLSFDSGRQHFGLDESGNAYCVRNWIRKLPGKDTARCHWADDRIEFRFGLPADAMVDRQIVDGCLPMTVSVWERDGVRYTQTAFVAPLAGVPKEGEFIQADDPLALMLRFEMQLLAGTGQADAALDFGVFVKDKPEPLIAKSRRISVMNEKDEWMRVFVPDAKGVKAQDGGVAYGARLTQKEPCHKFDLVIPYITLVNPTRTPEWKLLGALEFDPAFAAVRGYWHKRIEAGAQIHTPEPMIDEFYKAHVPHLFINTEREVGDGDRRVAKVGTFHYGMYANESCMMVSDLDLRGYHDRAAQVIETWLHYQGSKPLPGDYSSADGEFYGAGGYEDPNGYNQHHGWVMWCIGEHYWYTRDAAWLGHAAPHILKACDWIIRERQRTIEAAAASPIRSIERGLLPHGSLEDIGDWRSWMSNNVYACWGMNNATAALAAIGHPEANRLCEEAAAYKQDVLAAFTEAMRRSPVVRLRDGSWIPHFPSDAHRRGRSFGWITETLEGAIHLVRCGLLEPDSREATWILKDFEDNLYISEQYGYDIKGDDFARYWFSRGGISQQANLLCHPLPYLFRDEIPHYVRGYFNAFAVSYFPDTRMMTEHALPNIGDFRGDHYKTSDEANSTFWLRLMFVYERGDDLIVGAAIPRYWLADGQETGIDNAATYFGPMSVHYASHVAEGRIILTLDPPKRNPPKRILARFRHPDAAKILRCEVNGTPYDHFDPSKEWVELAPSSATTIITAYYK